jgi:hypothetical protein
MTSRVARHSPPIGWLGRFEHVLAIRQLVIVALRGILREVLDELPIVSLGVVEVATLAIGMRIAKYRSQFLTVSEQVMVYLGRHRTRLRHWEGL